jgi:hypothetical protein
MDGEVGAWLGARVLRLHPGRRVVTVALKGVGGHRCYRGQYVAPSEQIAPVADARTKRRVGGVVKVDPVAGGGAELSLVVGDDDAWLALAAGTAKVSVLAAFTGSSGGPVDGHPVRVEVG